MDIESARAAMRRYVASLNRDGQCEVRETGYEERIEGAWVFYFNSAEYLDTGAFETQLVGQGPTLILDNGSVLQGGSAERPSEVLNRFHGSAQA
ncbi:YrhB domain-containing protein [Sphingomonas sp. AR_OL41]|uniref:YrhB domain-containing protein n=1 Tax=Sphingomonas sp. AR_OL41 TaxID=3042729 RepID=UPI0024809D74|nr:YrhB domain-containing protein [Sphingomonas sp. AR_OL41]MDH7971171.1 YrhB domain-containing protein [Sphingomonas sp. AR_OL41]